MASVEWDKELIPWEGVSTFFLLPQVSTWSEKIFFEARDLVTLAEW